MSQQFASLPVDLGDGYSVEFCFVRGSVICEWLPDTLTKETPERVIDSYVLARDAFVAARLHRILGKVGPVTTVLKPSVEFTP